MPNKRNYDPFEVMRGNSKVLAGYKAQVQAIVTSIGSGFQRDLQLTKEPFIKACQVSAGSLGMLIEAVPKLNINEDKLQASMSDELFATEKVYTLVSQGMPFRDAYQQVKRELFG
jgi:argininosuccinate lyase